MNETEKLLRDALFALNSIPNRGLNHPEYRDTYKLAVAIDKHLKDLDSSTATREGNSND